jgi:hypothetical protein
MPLLGTDVWSLSSKLNDHNNELAELIKEVNQEIAEVQQTIKNIPPSPGAIFIYILNRGAFLKDSEKKVIELWKKVKELLLERLEG